MTIQATGRQADPVRPQPQLSIGQITAAQQLLLPKNPILPDSPFYQQKKLTRLYPSAHRWDSAQKICQTQPGMKISPTGRFS